MKSFLINCNLSLTSSQLHSTAIFILEEALALYRITVNEKSIYFDPLTRKELLAILYFLSHQPHLNLAGPILCIFREALRIERNVEIRNTCIQYFSGLNMLLNPKKYVYITHVSTESRHQVQEAEVEEVMNEITLKERDEPNSKTNNEKEVAQISNEERVDGIKEMNSESHVTNRHDVIFEEPSNDTNELNVIKSVDLLDEQRLDVLLLNHDQNQATDEMPPNKKQKCDYDDDDNKNNDDDDDDCLLVLKDFVSS